MIALALCPLECVEIVGGDDDDDDEYRTVFLAALEPRQVGV